MKYTKKIHNCETNEIIVEPLTAEEIEQLELRHAQKEAKKLAEDEAAAARVAARQILLDRLGITADEAKLLLS
jgi:hypothetical protein